MRLDLSLIAVLCALLASCSGNGLADGKGLADKGSADLKNPFKRNTIGGFTRADIANLRMRDLNPLARAPRLVKVKQSTLREIQRERRGLLPRLVRKPVDYSPPTLPAGALADHGGLLPSKHGTGSGSVAFDGLRPDPVLADADAGSRDPAGESGEEEHFPIE